jgi:hypothetical protein
MRPDLVTRLAAQFAAVEIARTELLRLAGELGAGCGVEVLRLRPGEEADVWELRLRIPSAAVGAATTTTVPSGEGEEEPFVSPARDAEPFVGDGTADLLRLIAASDPRVRIPPRGRFSEAAPPPLGAGERLRMLAGTIAGDAVLSLQHQGRERDGAAVRDALARAREHYAREVERTGGPEELVAGFDAAAERALRDLVGVC